MEDSAHVARQRPLQIQLIRPIYTQVGRTSIIAQMDEYVLCRINRFPNKVVLDIASSSKGETYAFNSHQRLTYPGIGLARLSLRLR